jgi:hypothetical protein
MPFRPMARVVLLPFYGNWNVFRSVDVIVYRHCGCCLLSARGKRSLAANTHEVRNLSPILLHFVRG